MSEKQRNNLRPACVQILGILILIPGFLVSSLRAAERMVPLPGHVPVQIQKAVKLGSAPDDELVSLSLVVALDQNLLDQALNQLYGRGAPSNKRFLTSSEFAQQFDLADKRQMLKNFALANGLTVDSNDQPESLVVKVSGSARAVQNAFHVQLNHYQKADGQLFRAAKTDPMIPESLAPHLSAILGLSNISGIAHPLVRKSRSTTQPGPIPTTASTKPGSFTFTGQDGAFLIPKDIQTVYGLTQVSLTGAGQSIALLELDGYSAADVTNFETQFGLPNTALTFKSIDGTANLCGEHQNLPCTLSTYNIETADNYNGMLEVALDIDMAMSLAPSLTQIMIYEGPGDQQGIYDIYNQMAVDNVAKVISTSWGYPEDEAATLSVSGASVSSFLQAENLVFQRMALQGQTIYAASGDTGAFGDPNEPSTPVVGDPASQPFVTGVGGTSLKGSDSAFLESTWNDAEGASGGGISAVWSLPSYQSGAGGASTQFRNVPDVALNADPESGYAIAVAGGFLTGVGGTSAAAPLWASFTALVDQERLARASGYLGFANPSLYDVAESTSSSLVFNDILAGSNGFYTTGPGYDNVTGWGSFRGTGAISTLGTVSLTNLLGVLDNVYAYPNPWDARKSSSRFITITNLPDGATVKIFTLSGFWVKTLTASNGGAIWQNLTNDAGERVASGLYFYLVTSGANQFRGTIAIIK